MRTAQLSLSVVVLTIAGALSLGAAAMQRPTPAAPAALDELWREPTNIATRDLFRGPSDGPAPPQEKSSYVFIKRDATGRSPGYDARDANGVTWSVKFGPEAQSEVTASRILWAIGFHQPPTYYLREWKLTGAPAGEQGSEDDLQMGGRFRPEVPGWTVVGDWKWAENPHMTWRPHGGLLVAQMIINNWDLKNSNNKLYEVTGTSGPRRRYVVRDLGASLGSNEQTKWLRWTQLRASQGTKNDVAGFVESGFIDHVDNGKVVFEYSGPNKALVSNIMVDDVKWTANLMSKLSDQQWRDAFRAGGYSEADSAKYIAKIKEKIATGLALK